MVAGPNVCVTVWLASQSSLELSRSLLQREVGGVRTERKHWKYPSRQVDRKELPVILFLVFQVKELKRIGINCGKFPSAWKKQ